MQFLSQKDLVELTGYQAPKKQIRWLQTNSFRFVIGADCAPKVLEEHVKQVLMHADKANTKRVKEPNFGALDGLMCG